MAYAPSTAHNRNIQFGETEREKRKYLLWLLDRKTASDMTVFTSFSVESPAVPVSVWL